MDRRERDLKKLAKRYGLKAHRGTKHHILVDEDGNVVATASATSSDGRAMKNLEAELRRWKKSQ